MFDRARIVPLALLVAACGGEEGGGSGPSRIDVFVAASTTSFAHDDGLSGQTARNVTAGVRSLALISEAGESWVLVDRGSEDVLVSWDAGDKSLLGTVFSDKVVKGRYVRARMVQAWSRFEVDATLHGASGAVPGALTGFFVTSDGTTVGGESFAAGHYEYEFTSESEGGSWIGDDALVPEHSTSAGAEAIVEDGEWAVYFPLDVEVAGGDGVLTITANMHAAFRWQDVTGGENQAGAWDIAPPLYEPVLQFGANRFDVVLEGR
jgi:hypothetical protein